MTTVKRKGLRTRFTTKSAWLSDQFGLDLAIRKLNMDESQIESVVGRYARGKRVGKLKGQLVWFRVEVGGWINGCGVVPRCSFGYTLADYYGTRYENFPQHWGEYEIARSLYHDFVAERNRAKTPAEMPKDISADISAWTEEIEEIQDFKEGLTSNVNDNPEIKMLIHLCNGLDSTPEPTDAELRDLLSYFNSIREKYKF